MAWPSARYKTATNGGSWTPGDMNGVQDQYLRATGILQDYLDASTVADVLGITQTAAAAGGAKVRRGKSVNAATRSRTNTAYGLLQAGEDVVTGLVLPTDGLIVVMYQALWQESVRGAGRAALFIGTNQLQARKNDTIGAQAAMKEAGSGTAVNVDAPLVSSPIGLIGIGDNAANAGADVTTGQTVAAAQNAGLANTIAGWELAGVAQTLATAIIGGACHIFAAAGTYDVSVQYKASSGSVTAKNRKLWVWTVGF